MAHDDIDAYEAALRQLPEAHSLALRLKSSDAADGVVCGCLHIDPEALETLLRVTEERLGASRTVQLHRPDLKGYRVSSQSHAEPK